VLPEAGDAAKTRSALHLRERADVGDPAHDMHRHGHVMSQCDLIERSEGATKLIGLMHSMEPTRADPRIGLVLNGRYRITAPIGEGGMGLVYLGERLELRRPVAIKFLQSPYADSAKFVTRFEREARAMSMLSHPYCVSVLDYGVHEAVPYIVMDFVTGSTLRQVIDEQRMSAQRALHVTRQVLIGLAHAHGQGVIHRDIKPGNIMLGEATGLTDHVRIFDFGLAKLHDPELHGEASIAAIVGTPAYMAPEQARADKVDQRADLYSAGVVLFEMLTGRKPFEAENAYQLLCLQRDKPPPRLTELAPELSAELEAVVNKALAKDPAARYQTAAEFGAALEATPEWASAGLPLVRPVNPASVEATLVSGQHVALEGAPTPRAHGAATRPARSSIGVGFPIFVLVLLGLVGFAVWKLRLDPRTLEIGSTIAARAREAREAVGPAVARTVGVDEPSAPGASAPDSHPPASDAVEAPVEGQAASEGAEEDQDSGELSEAALAAADEALNDREEREVVLDVSAERQKRPVASIADVRALIAKGESGAAIRGIQELRQKRPRDAQLPFLLGNVYFDKGWWQDGLAKYRETIALSSAYRKNARIQRDAIRALGQDRAYPRARALLVRDIGKAALPALRRAARANASQLSGRRANSIAKQLAR
jgi:serine/threonine-protein kinase